MSKSSTGLAAIGIAFASYLFLNQGFKSLKIIIPLGALIIVLGHFYLGKEEGKIEGLQQGLEKAKEIMAIKLFKKGMDIVEISNLTDLTIDQLKKLQNK